jgi:hypothetical protein
VYSFAFTPSRYAMHISINGQSSPADSIYEYRSNFPKQHHQLKHTLHMSSPLEEQESPKSSKNKTEDLDIDLPLFVIYTTSILGIASAAVLLWSEASIAVTRCGTIYLPEVVERSAYVSTFIIASGTTLSRIIFGSSMTELLMGDGIGGIVAGKRFFGSMEVLTIVSVLGAFALLAWQVLNGDAFAEGAGLSGIDVRWCKLTHEV